MIKKKIVIQGAYGDANIGDDLLLDVIIRLLKLKGFPLHSITIAGKKSSYLTKQYKGVKVVSSSSGKYINCDYLILGGGTQFFSFSKSAVQRSRAKVYYSVIKNDPLIVGRIIRNKLGLNRKPEKIAVGIGLGPFYNPQVERNVQNKLMKFKEVLCRDHKSLQYCKKWGLNSTLSADLCLSNLFSKSFPNTHVLNTSKKKVIGIVIRDWIQNNNGNIINKKVFEFIENCKSYYTIKIFLFSKDKDFALASKINQMDLVPKENIHIWNPDNDTFEKYLENFNLCDLVITSRYHAAIFALNYKIPTICLAIDPKLKFISDEVKGFSYCEIEDIYKLPSLIEKVFSNYQEAQQNIFQSYKALNIRANQIFDLQINN